MLWRLISALEALVVETRKSNLLKEKLVAELDDLKTAQAALAQAVLDAAAELKGVADALNALKGQATINPADVEAIAQDVSAKAAALEQAVTDTKGSTGV